MNRGVPPTAENARTGEFTPPGIAAHALSNRRREFSVRAAVSGPDGIGELPTTASLTSGPVTVRPGDRCRDQRGRSRYQRLGSGRNMMTVPPTDAATTASRTPGCRCRRRLR